MTQISITKAAKIAGVQRSTLYRKNKKGDLSFVKNSKGSDEVDIAELLRIYPNASIDNNNKNSTEYSTNDTELLRQENKFLLEKVTDREQLLEEAKDREQNLLNKIDAVQKTVDNQTLLIEDYHQEEKSKEENQKLLDKNNSLQDKLEEKEAALKEEKSKGFFKRLFGGKG